MTLRLKMPDPRWSDVLGHAIADAAAAASRGGFTVEGGGKALHLTPSDVQEKILLAALNRIDGARVERDPTDLFDRDGAVASLVLLYNVLGRLPHDDIADIEARIAALAVDSTDTIEMAVTAINARLDADEKVYLPDAKALKQSVKAAAQRIGYATHIAGAWARDGLVTFDVTRGLYDVVLHTEHDPVAGAMSPAVKWKHPNFALRFPGPDYPKIVDPTAGPYEVRGVLVSQFEDVPTREGHRIMRENMLAAGDVEDGCTFHELVDLLYPAARAAVPAGHYSYAVLFCGFRSDGFRHGKPVGSALENGFMRARAWVSTVREAIRDAAEASGEDSNIKANDPAYRRILNVIYGSALWMTYYDDGVPQKARPVRVKNAPGLPSNQVTPKAFVLGKGVKDVLT